MSEQNGEPRCKGNTYLQVKHTLQKELGEETFERILQRCQPETRRIVGGVILSNQWYTEHAFADFVQACFDQLGEARTLQYARAIARRQVPTFFRVLLRLFVSPRKFSENNHKLWQALHDTGELSVSHGEDDRSHLVTIKGFDFYNQAYERLFVEYHSTVLELTGARQVQGHSVRNQAGDYLMQFTWT